MHFKPYFFASNCPVTPIGWSRPHQHVSPSVRNKVSSLSAYCSSEHWLQPIKSDGTDYSVCLSVITSVHYNNDLAEPLSLLEVRHCSCPPLSCVLFVATIRKIVTIHTYLCITKIFYRLFNYPCLTHIESTDAVNRPLTF